jgi:surface-anchored protein
VRLRLGLLISATIAATLTTGLTPASASSLVVISQGHVDVVDVEYADGTFDLHVHDETVDPPAERDPADVIFGVRPEARTTVPDDPAFAFLGSPGDPVWILPEVDNPELLFAGLGTEELEPGVFAGDAITLTLHRVRGPGSVSLFVSDPFGAPQVLWNGRDGLPDQFTLPVGTHQHANWAFTERGLYRLTIQATATLTGGGSVRSDPTTFTFWVR